MREHDAAILSEGMERAGRGRPGSSVEDVGLWRPDALVGRFDSDVFSLKGAQYGR